MTKINISKQKIQITIIIILFFFEPHEDHKIIGEATPIYMYWKNAIKRIYNYNSDMKLILVLRNPIDRAFSHWNMEVHRKREDRTFLECNQ